MITKANNFALRDPMTALAPCSDSPVPKACATAAVVPAASTRQLWQLPGSVAFPVFALVLFTFFFSASAPSPIFLVLQKAWHFSPSMLTVAFAIYAVALLASLLVAGSLSDHVGRRPVLIASMLLQGSAMAAFVSAESIGGLIVARIVQGIATGMATGAMTAAVVEAAPESKKKLGATLSSVAPLAGLALGALLTGVAVQLSADPTTVVFSTLTAMFLLGAVAVFFTPESVTRRPGAWASLIPRVSVPARARPDFMRALPVFITVWALAGLYLALAPSMMLHLFHAGGGFMGGLTIAVLSGVGAAAPYLLSRFVPVKAVVFGAIAMAFGTAFLMVAVYLQSLALFLGATAIAGVGFGGSFSALLQILAPQAAPQERGELFAAIFVACYLAFSVPAMIAGLLVTPLGLQPTVEGYAIALIALASFGALLQWRSLK